MTQTYSLTFHFYNLSIKIKKVGEKYVFKNIIFRLVAYEKSFQSSVTRGKMADDRLYSMIGGNTTGKATRHRIKAERYRPRQAKRAPSTMHKIGRFSSSGSLLSNHTFCSIEMILLADSECPSRTARMFSIVFNSNSIVLQ